MAVLLFTPVLLWAQVSPGPLEIMPPDDAYITEAWRDLNGSSGSISSDWTGYSFNNSGGYSAWNSPHCYPHHTGTDFSMQSGTTLRASAAGTVSAVVNNIPLGTYQSNSGNYVRVAVDTLSPSGETIDFLTCHMSPNSPITVGQRVSVGTVLGYSDSTGQVDSEHLHWQAQLRSGTVLCPFYYGLCKYPIMLNQTATKQVGHVVRVNAASTPVRADLNGFPPDDTATILTTVYQNQLYFASYWHQGYYRIFIPNNTGNRSGWVKAIDVSEVFTGTVIQPLPDGTTYVHTTTLASPYVIRATASPSAAQVGQIVYGGGRFVADQVQSGWYRIAVPGSATWGWVLPDSRMVVYPELTNPSINLSSRPDDELPIQDGFSSVGPTTLGRPKFRHCDVRNFSPAAPGGDGKALYVSDTGNVGACSRQIESVLVGKVNHRNYYVQAYCYFNFRANGTNGFDRYGILFRDDGFTGMTDTYEGRGNAYAIVWDCDDGRLRAGIFKNSAVTDWLPTQRLIASSGWHKLRIEGHEDQISFYLDDTLLVSRTDTSFPSGPCAMCYENRFNSAPSDRGAYFDNFAAGSLDIAAAENWALLY